MVYTVNHDSLLRHPAQQGVRVGPFLDVFTGGTPDTAAEPDRYLHLATADWRMAALLWARVRNAGRTTASPDALDGDVLIAAQAETLDPAAHGLAARIVATANVNHLSTLTRAALWSDITP